VLKQEAVFDGASEGCASLECLSRRQFLDGASEGCASLECLSRRQFLDGASEGCAMLRQEAWWCHKHGGYCRWLYVLLRQDALSGWCFKRVCIA